MCRKKVFKWKTKPNNNKKNAFLEDISAYKQKKILKTVMETIFDVYLLQYWCYFKISHL